MTDTITEPRASRAAAGTPGDLNSAVEAGGASALHDAGSYDLADHPRPTGREEAWRFTPLKRLRGLLDAEPGRAEGEGTHLTWTSDLPDGVTLSAITAEEAVALGEFRPTDRLAALAVAKAGGAVLLDVAADAVLDRPVTVTLSGDDPQAQVWGQVVVRVGRHAQATIVVEHRGSTTYAASTSVLVGDGAQVDLVQLQLWEDDSVHAGQVGLRVGRDAALRAFDVSLGGDLVRLSTVVEFDGPGGAVEHFGVYFADAGQHIEHRMFVDHNEPRTTSNVLHKGALQGLGARTVWIGDVLIRTVAQGIDTFEQNDNLVLTDGARADSVPNLEIETGDIAGAGHASTTGRFDDEHLFYLQSRGIPEDEARRLVVHGFFNDILRRIRVDPIREQMLAAIEAELAATASAAPA